MRSPQFAPVRSIHQISLHPHFIAVLGNAAHQNRTDLQLLPDLLWVVVLSLEPEDRASRHHFEIGHPRQGTDQALGQAVAEVLFASAVAFTKGSTATESILFAPDPPRIKYTAAPITTTI